jgi:hypothetical protein
MRLRLPYNSKVGLFTRGCKKKSREFLGIHKTVAGSVGFAAEAQSYSVGV